MSCVIVRDCDRETRVTAGVWSVDWSLAVTQCVCTYVLVYRAVDRVYYRYILSRRFSTHALLSATLRAITHIHKKKPLAGRIARDAVLSAVRTRQSYQCPVRVLPHVYLVVLIRRLVRTRVVAAGTIIVQRRVLHAHFLDVAGLGRCPILATP